MLRGLCLERCVETLAERYESEMPFDILACITGIKAGIKHLHQRGLAHNDIRPSNILLKKDDTAVIIDFDTYHPIGMELVLKAGGMGSTYSAFQK